MGIRYWQRTTTERKEWWKARSTQGVVLERMAMRKKNKCFIKSFTGDMRKHKTFRQYIMTERDNLVFAEPSNQR
jgi:hypothetical protein